MNFSVFGQIQLPIGQKIFFPCQDNFKEILHSKMKIAINHFTPMSFQTRKPFVPLQNTIKGILDENQEACDCPIDCRVNCTVKVQKSMKDIVRIVHLSSDVQSESYDATRILCAQRKLNIDFIQLFLLLRDTSCKCVHEFIIRARRKHASDDAWP